jgi:hypothetical protein
MKYLRNIWFIRTEKYCWMVWVSITNSLLVIISNCRFMNNCLIVLSCNKFSLSKGIQAVQKHKIQHISQNSISWFSQRFQNFSPSCLACSCPLTWSQCLAIWLSSWSSALTLTSPPQCTFSSRTCPWLTLVYVPPSSQRWSWTFKLWAESSLMWAASLRYLFSYCFDVWMTCFWLWWLMTGM